MAFPVFASPWFTQPQGPGGNWYDSAGHEILCHSEAWRFFNIPFSVTAIRFVAHIHPGRVTDPRRMRVSVDPSNGYWVPVNGREYFLSSRLTRLLYHAPLPPTIFVECQIQPRKEQSMTHEHVTVPDADGHPIAVGDYVTLKFAVTEVHPELDENLTLLAPLAVNRNEGPPVLKCNSRLTQLMVRAFKPLLIVALLSFPAADLQAGHGKLCGLLRGGPIRSVLKSKFTRKAERRAMRGERRLGGGCGLLCRNDGG